MTPAEQIVRAFEISDEAMFELLQAHCIPQDEFRVVLGLTGESGGEVAAFAAASQAIHDAYEWLAERGYVELDEDESGEYIFVKRRPGEDEG